MSVCFFFNTRGSTYFKLSITTGMVFKNTGIANTDYYKQDDIY